MTYVLPEPAGTLLIYNVNPTEGAIAGGEQVTLTGNGIRTPVEVTFSVNGTSFPARVLSVVPSTSSSPGTITVETPRVTVADATIDNPATITVKTAVGTGKDQSQVLVNAFTFLREIFTPVIYSVYPDQGTARGGEQVTILGANLVGVTRVTFGGNEAQVVSESADGHQVTVITPPYGATPLQDNIAVAVVVETPGGNASKDDAFIYLADQPQPTIAGLAPAAGPIDGGTRVTIFGSGFQFPAQVFFSAGGVTKEASVISVNDDTSPADNDEIVCVTPDFSDSTQTTPFTADIRVLNVETGREGTKDAAFTYGDRLFVSGNDPADGGEGTEVTIFGSGFVSPLQVDYLGFSNPLRVDPTSISGSQMVVRMPAPTNPSCAAVTGAFRVRLLESPNNPVEGGSFTYFGNTPTLSSITPSTVDEIADGVGVDPSSAVLTGKNFSTSVQVAIKSILLNSGAIQAVNDTTINITQLPAPNDLGLVFDTVACVNGDGVAGLRKVPTSVDVTVTNTNANCSDTLTKGLTYQPQNTDCVVEPNIVLVPAAGSTVTLPATGAGSCSTFEQVTVRNTGGSNLDWTAAITGPFSFSGSSGDLNRSGSLVPGTSSTIEVHFCPTVDDNSNQFGQVQFLSNDPNDNPVTLHLQGQEAAGQLELTPPNLNFPSTAGGSCSAAQQATIRNTGLDDLSYNSTLTGRFFFDAGASQQGPVAGSLPPGTDTLVDIYFCPNLGASGTLTGQLSVDSDDPVNPVRTVALSGDAGAPDISVTPNPLIFDEAVPAVGPGPTCSSAKQLTIANSAGASDDLDFGLTLTGDFYLNDNATGQGPQIGSLVPGASQPVNIYFCPAMGSVGLVTGTARVTSNDPDQPLVVNDLQGTATGPEIECPAQSRSELAFTPATIPPGAAPPPPRR